MKVKLSRDDIILGKPIPWALYNENGTRLFRKGIVINNSASLGKLLRMDLYRDPLGPNESSQDQDTARVEPAAAEARPDTSTVSGNLQDPFTQVDKLAVSIKNNFDGLVTGKKQALHAIMRLAEEIRVLHDTHPEESLAVVHLVYDHDYSCIQPLYCAILCEMLAQDRGYPIQRRRSLVAAALTANIGMYEYYDRLNNQSGALNQYQVKMIQAHPEKGCRMLKNAGLHDSVWLSIIEQHHERPDGSGYPRGLTKDQILAEATLVSIVDFYLSLIMPRAYRDPILSRDALQRMYKAASQYNKAVISAFIKKLGVYPPGTFVKLSNNEIAVVTKRSEGSATHPRVVSIGMLGKSENFEPRIRNIMKSDITIDDAYQFKSRHPLDLRYIWSLR